MDFFLIKNNNFCCIYSKKYVEIKGTWSSQKINLVILFFTLLKSENHPYKMISNLVPFHILHIFIFETLISFRVISKIVPSFETKDVPQFTVVRFDFELFLS